MMWCAKNEEIKGVRMYGHDGVAETIWFDLIYVYVYMYVYVYVYIVSNIAYMT